MAEYESKEAGVTAQSSQDVERPATTVADADKDVAMAMVGEEQHAVDPVVVARAVRKIDRFLIPAMILGCECVAVAAIPRCPPCANHTYRYMQLTRLYVLQTASCTMTKRSSARPCSSA